MNIRFTEEALEEFAQAAAWYESERIGLGEKFRQAVVASAMSATEFPAAGSRVTDRIRRRGTRPFPHMLYYVVRDEEPIVVAVFHGRRDPASLEDRDG